MFLNQTVLKRFVSKIVNLSSILSNRKRINFHNFDFKFQVSMSTAKSFPDIYVLLELHAFNKELKKYLPENVNIVEVPIKDCDQNIEIPAATMDILQRAEILVTSGAYVMQLLYNLPNTKWIQNSWAGVESVIKKLDRSKPLPNFTLTRYSDSYFGDAMANYVMAQIINIERRFYIYHDKQKVAEWENPNIARNYRVLSDLTVGVLGAGNIGSAVGRHLKNAGSRVIAYVRKARDRPCDAYDEAVTDLSPVLSECDYICNVLPSTESTRGLLDNDVLKSCKKRPVFINVGRGDIIQADNLIKALREGWISGAVLDVFTDEPLPSDSPLWKMPEVHITPHIGAVTAAGGLAKFTASNYLRYIKGEPLMNVVDWNVGY